MGALRPGLYAVTDSALPKGRPAEAVASAIRGGAVMVQYRDKGADRGRRLREARDLHALCRAHAVPLVINDDVDLALEVGADGVHVGKEDAAYGTARAALGRDAIIGVSCYDDLERALAAEAAGADYVAFGSFFASTVKPNAVHADTGLLRRAKRNIAIPLVAIGGITAENGGPLVEAGADMLAVISGLFGQPDIEAAAARFSRLYELACSAAEAHRKNAIRPTAGPVAGSVRVLRRRGDDELEQLKKGLTMPHSHELFVAAQRHIPGGVNSPVRAFRGVGGEPLFFKRGEGPYIYSESDRRYIDYVGSWGPMIAGHAHPRVIEAVRDAATNGLSFGAPTVLETHMADRLCELVPSMDLVRMVNSGTEATMSAIRLARGFTGRDKIVKFEGCYHGHSDSLLVKAGSGALTLGVPSSPGVPAALAEHTITLPYNDIDAVREAFGRIGGQVACVIVEPVAGNMNCIPPEPGFLEGLRATCDEYGSLLVFDEVMTGFRVALGGAQAHYGIRPDLTTLGKVVGGGMPVGAFGGRREVMEQIAPLGPIYQAGTLSGNPVAMAAGLATLGIITQPGFHQALTEQTSRLVGGILAKAREQGIPMTANQVGGMFGLFFSGEESITRYEQVLACNVERFKLFFHGMLNEGVYLAPSAFEAGFVSSAHSRADIEATIEAAGRVLATL